MLKTEHQLYFQEKKLALLDLHGFKVLASLEALAFSFHRTDQ